MTCIDLMTNRSKQRKTTKAIELRWIASIWRQNDQKCFVTSQNIENNSKLQKYSNYDEFASIWSRNDKNIDLRCKQFKSKQSYKIDQSTMNCIDLMTKRSKQRNTTRTIDDEFHQFDDKTFKTTLNYKSAQTTMTCIDLMTKRSKQRKTTKAIELRWTASIWRQNVQKCLVTSQNIDNNSKLQKYSNYDEFASIWSRNDKNIDLRRKQFKTTQSYKTDQSTMNCIDWMTKRSEQRKTTKAIELRWIASISRQNEQKCWVTSQTVQNNA